MELFRRLLRKGLSFGLGLLPFSVLIKFRQKKIIFPLYHTISNSRLAHVIHLFPYRNVNKFEDDLDFFLRHFIPVSLEDIMNWINGGKELPANSFLLTFDDGYRESIEIIAPILKKRSIPAVFFLNTSFIDNKNMFYRHKASLIVDHLELSKNSTMNFELAKLLNVKQATSSNISNAIMKIKYHKRQMLDESARILEIDFNRYLRENKPYLNSDEIIKLLDMGFSIGSHSIDHPLFSDISIDNQINQVSESIDVLKRKFNILYRSFAFPHTDEGISEDFFYQTHLSRKIDISFGTSNFSDGHYFNNFQRQPMEMFEMHANKIYKNLFRDDILRWIK